MLSSDLYFKTIPLAFPWRMNWSVKVEARHSVCKTSGNDVPWVRVGGNGEREKWVDSKCDLQIALLS